MDVEKINAVLKKHIAWLNNKDRGERADFSFANLQEANLREANLLRADLQGVNLQGADLWRANLQGANLQGADLKRANLRDANLLGVNLQGADLWEANLQEAYLQGANLRGAYLQGANLRGADLRGADLLGADLWRTINIPKLIESKLMACPEEGSFIGWKKCGNYIIKLRIPDDAKRSSATTRKCRCSKAEVLAIQNIDGSDAKITSYVHEAYDNETVFEIGKVVYPDSFDENRWIECSHGIHFFITREEAVNY